MNGHAAGKMNGNSSAERNGTGSNGNGNVNQFGNGRTNGYPTHAQIQMLQTAFMNQAQLNNAHNGNQIPFANQLLQASAASSSQSPTLMDYQNSYPEDQQGQSSAVSSQRPNLRVTIPNQVCTFVDK